ncbi:UPF0223 family protein [Anaerobacillus sp. MEB173]|uniref:UPF0223 family protein n=1 Tax=Anaerobacillus sp. MEB173 TaxID=3383345 RepID=UPI003F8E63B1
MEMNMPISLDWSTEEVVDVVSFYEGVVQAYEKGIRKEEVLRLYQRFKEIVPSKSEEKQLCGQFDKESGYSCFRTVKRAREAKEGEMIKM